jgi:phosphohistidine phosphatase SixA
VGEVLDAFHEAAARADEEAYFGCFAPEGVFLGTDPDERWTFEEFRAWAAPYFERETAWTFVPRSRSVQVDPGTGRFAWFDEVLDSESYGRCRGTGALRRTVAGWKIVQYDLTVPVPNELLGDVVRRIRGESRLPATIVVLVRHAEKEARPGDPDPPLTDAGRRRAERLAAMLRDAKPDAIYTTPYRRTRDTVAPTAALAGVEPIEIGAGDREGLVQRLAGGHAGETVLVCGHSNTLPAILRDLGVPEPGTIADDEYDGLYLLALRPGERPALLRLRFGD